MNTKDCKIFAWACDLENYRGEGILGLNFLKHLSELKNKKIYAETPSGTFIINKKKIYTIKKTKVKKINLNFIYNYLYPFFGVIKIWTCKNKYKEVSYVNFLPLWNFFLLLLLPKRTILGPVTGGVYLGSIKNLNSLIRKKLIPIFYKMTLKIAEYRDIKLLFTTEILKKFLNSGKKNYYFFNYNLINYCSQKFKIEDKRYIDILFYYRKYAAHNSNQQLNIIKILAKQKFKIFVVGDYLNEKNVNNLGIISRKKIWEYLKKTKFSINEGTNFFSIFCLDCISCGTKVFFDKKIKLNQTFFPKNFFYQINFDKPNISAFKIKNRLNNYNYKKTNKIEFNVDFLKKNYNNYFI
jgi:hypothetical protein